jgi:hypothetical protein
LDAIAAVLGRCPDRQPVIRQTVVTGGFKCACVSLEDYRRLANGRARRSCGRQEKSEVRVYSSVCVHPESGDLLGARLVLLRFAEHDYAVFQLAQGQMGPTDTSIAEVSDKLKITFDATGADDKPVTFRGTLADATLSGKFDNEAFGGRCSSCRGSAWARSAIPSASNRIGMSGRRRSLRAREGLTMVDRIRPWDALVRCLRSLGIPR